MKSLLQIPAGTKPWLMVISALTLVQAALLHWGIQQFTEIRPAPVSSQSFSVVLGEESADSLLDRLWLASPMMFALPSLEGFSGAAWLRYRTPSAQINRIEDQATYLEMDPQFLGQKFRAFAEQQVPTPMRVADLPVVWRDSFPIETPSQRHSELVLEGELARRTLLNPIPLPDWPHTDVAAESHVQVLVDGAGRVLTAVLLESEGQLSISSLARSTRIPEADTFALNVAREARFAPVPPTEPRAAWEPPAELVSGRMIFQWNTTPVVNTNRVAF